MSLDALIQATGDSASESYEVQEYGHISVQDDNGNTVIISEDEHGNLQVYYADHATLTIEGVSNEQPQVTLDSDEYSFDLTVMDTEDAVETLQLKNLNI